MIHADRLRLRSTCVAAGEKRRKNHGRYGGWCVACALTFLHDKQRFLGVVVFFASFTAGQKQCRQHHVRLTGKLPLQKCLSHVGH